MVGEVRTEPVFHDTLFRQKRKKGEYRLSLIHI